MIRFGLIIAMGVAISMALQGRIWAEDLSPYRWQARPLLIFAPSEQSPLLSQQLQSMTDQDAFLKDRDMVVAIVYPDLVRFVFGAPQDLSAKALRRQFRVSDTAFSVMLIGKDGGTKTRSYQPVDLADMYQLIDAMPMRQQEMRGKNN